MTVYVDTYRASAGGYLKLALLDVAGSGEIASVDLSPSQVGTIMY
jgi:hypothetical protein